VGRRYGGVLGLLAFLTVIARGFVRGGGVEPTLFAAWLSLLAFVPLGCIVGRLAEWTLEESIRSKLAADLAARDATDSASPGKTNP
jgi:hypothetical protein